MNDRSGIQSARAAEKKSALQQANIFFTVETVTALGALWCQKSERFPSTQSGGGNTDAFGHFADAQRTVRGI
jgi:hypothetical protein